MSSEVINRSAQVRMSSDIQVHIHNLEFNTSSQLVGVLFGVLNSHPGQGLLDCLVMTDQT